MQLFVSLERQGVGQDGIAVCKVASELLADKALFMIQNMAPNVICASKRGRTSLDWTWQTFSRFDLLASELVGA